MSEDPAANPTEGGSSEGATTPGAKEKVEFTDEQQSRINALLAEQKRQIHSKFADYDDLKAKATRIDDVEREKSEVEGQILAKVTEQLKAHMVSLHEISDEDAELFLTADNPELLGRQVSRLLDRQESGKPADNRAPSEGANPKPQVDERRAFADFLTGNQSA